MEIRKISRSFPKQQGAVVVEFAVSILLFIVIIMAIIEFSLLILHFSRANEVTRDLARMAIVSTPVCGISEEDEVCNLDCSDPEATPVIADLAGSTADCDPANPNTACRLLGRAQEFIPAIQPTQLEVTYACSYAGLEDRPRAIPLITVGLKDLTYPLMLPGLFGLSETEIPIPGFETSRTGESLYTIGQL